MHSKQGLPQNIDDDIPESRSHARRSMVRLSPLLDNIQSCHRRKKDRTDEECTTFPFHLGLQAPLQPLHRLSRCHPRAVSHKSVSLGAVCTPRILALRQETVPKNCSTYKLHPQDPLENSVYFPYIRLLIYVFDCL